jgi:predicted negative regulator of RcsB-dependent stress response
MLASRPAVQPPDPALNPWFRAAFLLTFRTLRLYLARPFSGLLRPSGAVLSETIRITKKDIQEARAPDAVLEGATSVYDWIVARRNLVLGALAALLVATVAVSVVRSSRETSRRELGAKLSAAVALANRPVTEGKPTGSESFATKAEKTKAVDEALAAIVRDHAGTEAARTAALQLASVQLRNGRFDDALSGLKAYSNDGVAPEQQVFVAENLGYAYEQKGDLDQAAAAFKGLETPAPARAAYHAGRIAELKGDKAAARAAYQRVVGEFGTDPVAGDARVRLDLLELAPATEPGFAAAPPAPAPAAKSAKKAPSRRAK